MSRAIASTSIPSTASGDGLVASVQREIDQYYARMRQQQADQQWRNDWVARLRETEETFGRVLNTGDIFFTLFYDTPRRGNISYHTQGDRRWETIAFELDLNLRDDKVWLRSAQNTLQAVNNGLTDTNRRSAWNLANWPTQRVSGGGANPFVFQKNYTVSAEVELVNAHGEVLGRQTVNFSPSYNINITSGFLNRSHYQTITFRNVRVDQLTDNLIVRVVSINGAAPESGQISTAAVPGNTFQRYMQFETDFTVQDATLTGFARNIPNNRLQQYQSHLVIPDTLWGEPFAVTIGERAFYDRRISRLTIGNSVTSIGRSAFERNSIESVTIPNSVTTIGGSAFRGSYIRSLTLGNSVTSIGDWAFMDHRLTSLTIPASVQHIGDRAFLRLRSNHPGEGEMSITFLGNVNSIAREAFSFLLGTFAVQNTFSRLTSITIPDNFNQMGIFSMLTGFTEFYEKNGRRGGTYSCAQDRHGNWQWRYSRR